MLRPWHDLYCLCYGQRRNILIENLYDHNFPSKKYYRRPDIGNVVAELYSSAKDLMTETVNLLRESPSQFSLLLSVRE